MATFLTTGDSALFETAMNDHFDTFQRVVTVHKEPKRTFSNTNADVYVGYGIPSHERNVTLTPVSSQFSGVMQYMNRETDLPLPDLNTSVPENKVRIKVKSAARDYIENGKTELIEVDNKKYNLISSDGQQNFLGLRFYLYILKEVE